MACLEVPATALPPADRRALVDRLVPIVQGRDVALVIGALVISEDADLAAAAGADGVVLEGAAGYRAARGVLGADAIVGIRAGASRHDAMVAGEMGADFVGLTGDPDLVSWWAEVMEPPAVAFAGGHDPAVIDTLAAAGADFVAPAPSLWLGDADRPAAPAVLAARLQALAQAPQHSVVKQT